MLGYENAALLHQGQNIDESPARLIILLLLGVLRVTGRDRQAVETTGGGQRIPEDQHLSDRGWLPLCFDCSGNRGEGRGYSEQFVEEWLHVYTIFAEYECEISQQARSGRFEGL